MRRAVWRLVRAELAKRAIDGEGARIPGGRWNPPGSPAVHAAGSRALAAPEELAHLPQPLRSAAFTLHRIEFATAAVEDLAADELPGDWTQFPPPRSTQTIGRLGLARASHPVLRVPSVLLPEEDNYLFNPHHPAFAALPVERERFFFLAPRLD